MIPIITKNGEQLSPGIFKYAFQDAESIGLEITSVDFNNKISGKFIKGAEYCANIIVENFPGIEIFDPATHFLYKRNILINNLIGKVENGENDDFELASNELESIFLDSVLNYYLNILNVISESKI